MRRCSSSSRETRTAPNRLVYSLSSLSSSVDRLLDGCSLCCRSSDACRLRHNTRFFSSPPLSLAFFPMTVVSIPSNPIEPDEHGGSEKEKYTLHSCSCFVCPYHQHRHDTLHHTALIVCCGFFLDPTTQQSSRQSRQHRCLPIHTDAKDRRKEQNHHHPKRTKHQRDDKRGAEPVNRGQRGQCCNGRLMDASCRSSCW